MITPTVGRVVWVRGRVRGSDVGQPEAALVTYVHSDTLINVAGFDYNGGHFALTSLYLNQDGPAPSDGRWWAEWMPYQKGQAARTEQLEKQVGSGG